MPDGLGILIVEDNEINWEVALLMLDELGLNADVVGSGIEALEAVRSVHYDVVLMDIQIPEMDGMETTRRIRSEISETMQPFIIAMTAGVTIEERILYRQAGMDDLLAKPLHLRELSAALAHGSSGPSGTLDPVSNGQVDEHHQTRQPRSDSKLPISLAEPLTVYDPLPLDNLVADLGPNGSELRRALIEDFLRGDSDRRANVAAAGYDPSGVALDFIAHDLRSIGATLGLLALSEVATRIDLQFRTAPEQLDVAIEASELLSQCLRASTALRLVLDAEADSS